MERQFMKRRGFWKRFFVNHRAVFGLWILAIIVLLCFGLLPWTGKAYDLQNLTQRLQTPGEKHLLGTDELGRSIGVRLLYGGCISLGVGACAAGVSVVIGLAWGTVAGYLGGRIDDCMMRVVDILYCLPYILLVMLFVVIFGRQIGVLFLAIGAVSWLTMSRVVRGQVLVLREMGFVESARAQGAGVFHIIRRHILPNLAGPVLVYGTLVIPQAILQESFLSFLGIGVQPPTPSWGSLAAGALGAISTVKFYWWLVLPPIGMLTLTLVCMNFIGDGLRDALAHTDTEAAAI
jgi:oligopeptide transport system permease protein